MWEKQFEELNGDSCLSLANGANTEGKKYLQHKQQTKKEDYFKNSSKQPMEWIHLSVSSIEQCKNKMHTPNNIQLLHSKAVVCQVPFLSKCPAKHQYNK